MQDIAGWEAALKQAAGTHKTLVHAVIQYKELLADSEHRLQQERASHRELAAQFMSCASRTHAGCCPSSQVLRTFWKSTAIAITAYPSVLAPAGESIQQMSLMKAQIQEKTAALAAQEETMHSLRCSEERLAKLAGNQRQRIQDLQVQLMDNLYEVKHPVLQL